MSDDNSVVSSREVERLVGRLAADHDVALSGVEWVPGRGGAVIRGSGGWRVQLGADLLTDSAAARFVAAHEVGHLVLGHVGRRAVHVLVVVLAGILVASLGTGSVLGWVWAGEAGSVVGIGVAGWVGLVLVRQLWVTRTLNGELAADRFARANGCPLTVAVARLLTGAEPPRAVVDRMFPSHPSWARRLAVSA